MKTYLGFFHVRVVPNLFKNSCRIRKKLEKKTYLRLEIHLRLEPLPLLLSVFRWSFGLSRWLGTKQGDGGGHFSGCWAHRGVVVVVRCRRRGP